MNLLDMKPMWLAFPKIKWGSIGWRMGEGERYIGEWHRAYNAASESKRTNYQAKYPEPDEWRGFYEFNGSDKKGPLPPKLFENLFGRPPADGEDRRPRNSN